MLPDLKALVESTTRGDPESPLLWTARSQRNIVDALEKRGHHINETIRRQLEANEPVISVDTKKRELVGPYKNGGRELRAQEDPEEVNVHDFIDPEQGRATPYGVYDLQQDEAWVSVGISF